MEAPPKAAFSDNSNSPSASRDSLLAAIVDSSEDAVIGIDLNGRVITWNRGAERIFGYRAEEIAGSPVSVLAVSEQRNEMPEMLARIHRGERIDHYETVRRAKDGKHISVSLAVSPVRNASGEIVGASKVARDITLRQRAEQAIAEQGRILEMIARGAHLDEVLPALCRAFDRQLPGATSFVLLFRSETGKLHVEAAPNVPSWYRDASAHGISPESSSYAAALQRGEPVIVADIAADSLWEEGRALALKAGFRACWSTPIVSDHGKPLGAFGIYFAEPRAPSPDEADVVTGWVHLASIATSRAQTEQSLRTREEQFRTLLANTPDVISRFDRSLRIQYVSAAVERATGLPPEHFIGKRHAEAGLDAELSGRLESALEEIFVSGEMGTVDFAMPNPAGELRRYHGLGVPEPGKDGSIHTVLTIVRDVTERKAAEDAQQSIERHLLLLVEASSTLLASPQSSEVLRTILELSQRFVAADAYSVWRLESEVWRLISSAGLSEDYVQSGLTSAANYSLTGPLLIEDVSQSGSLGSRREPLTREGVRSMMVIPLVVHGQPTGTVVFYWRSSHRSSDDEVRIAKALGNLAASALGTAELYEHQATLRAEAEAAERRASFLAEAGAVLASSLDYHATLSSVARLAVPALADWAAVDLIDEHGAVQRVAVEHTDPTKVRFAYEFTKRYPPREDDMPKVALRTGKSVLVADITDELLVARARDSEHLRLLRELGLKSVIVAPMLVSGRSLGLITFVASESGRRYTEADLQTAEELARRAAFAIAHAQLYENLRHREERYRSLVSATSSVVWTVDPTGRFIEPQPSWEAYTGQSWAEHRDFGWADAIHPNDRAAVEAVWVRCRDEARTYESEGRLWHAPSGEYRYFVARAVPVRGRDGAVREWVGTITDTHERRLAEEERSRLLIREKEARETAELLNQVGPVLAAELDRRKLAQSITDIATRVTGAGFGALFQNALDERGEYFALYTLSGVDRDAFAHLPMPRNTALFEATFRNRGVVRSDDITLDPRYGHNHPHHGLPVGHVPVRSYLAVSVVSRSGDVLGGLFFGHSETGRFTEWHERVVTGIAAQAAIALDNARLFTESRLARELAERSNEELRRANADLEQFAYSASHDLKEPLRMVAVYSQMLQRRYKGKLDAEADEYLGYAIQGALRMEALVRDLLAYTQAVTGSAPETLEPIDAGKVLQEAIVNLRGAIEESNAVIETAPLPDLRVSEVHLLQLFQNLIGNAVKYRGEAPPRISLTAEPAGQLWRLCIRDNGIGIAPQYSEQVFGIFKRLHNADKYAGTGIGLAICQKIVHRYGGRIWVESEGEGRGSSFFFTLPGA